MFALRIILIPFSLIYSVIISIRNKFYDYGIFKSYHVSKPVISIGNITTGGTGKTPFTIYIAEYLLSKGKKVGIISRGYKRESSGMVLVSDGNMINDKIEESGDELILITNELIEQHKGKFCIAAGSDRVAAANYLINNFGPDLIILDDGFQYRRLKRDLDLVLIDSRNYLSEKFLNAFTLPSGIRREGFSSLCRVDIIIQNNKNSNAGIISGIEKYGKEILPVRYKTEYFMDSKNSILKTDKIKAVVFSGIADDESFIYMIKESGIDITESVRYNDHHNYSDADINNLKQKFSAGNIFITTEKDFVKVSKFSDFINDYPVYFLKMKIEPGSNAEKLFNKLDEFIK